MYYLNFPSSNSDGTTSAATASVVQTFAGIAPQGSHYVKVPESLPPSSDGFWYRRSSQILVLVISQFLKGSCELTLVRFPLPQLAEGIAALIPAYAAHPGRLVQILIGLYFSLRSLPPTLPPDTPPSRSQVANLFLCFASWSRVRVQ